jgi:arylsulfatase A-like enzyme
MDVAMGDGQSTSRVSPISTRGRPSARSYASGSPLMGASYARSLHGALAMPPNVVIVITHDTGRHLGAYGRRVNTPHLDRLASEGVLFERAFCTAPQCSPSRASLLTGLVPHRHGLIGLAHRGFSLGPAALRRTLPRLLGAAGYRTHLFGFQHEAADPRALGYQHVVQPPSSGGRPHLCRDVAPAAADFLASGLAGRGEPFFAMVGFEETHRPFDPTDTPLDDVRVPPYLPDTPVVRRDVADLEGAVREVDAAVGRMLAALDRSGLAERTLFVYTTDHGIAFPGAKGTLLDPGIEIALIARGPAGLAGPAGSAGFRGGRRLGGLASNVDLWPTILGVCGVDPPSDGDGVSLMPMVAGDARDVRTDLFAELTYHTAYDPMRAVRTERHAYIRSFADRPLHLPAHVDASPTKDLLRERGYFEARRPRELLFDVAHDPLERTNLVGDPAHAASLADLRSRLDGWMRATDDPLLGGEVPAPPGAVLTPADSYTADGLPAATSER